MPRSRTTIRYDGAAVVDHSMDAADLAPALSALSDLVKAANRELYGDNASVVLVVRNSSDPQCFQFEVEVIQAVAEHVISLFGDEDLSPAQRIAAVVGLLGVGVGLFGLYKWIASQGVSTDGLSIQKEAGNVTIRNVHSNARVIVNNTTYNLTQAPGVTDNVKTVVRPLARGEYNRLEFEQNGQTVQEFSPDEGRNICSLDIEFIDPASRVNSSTSRAKVKVKKPDLLAGSMWSVVHHKAINVKIEDEQWLSRFQSAQITMPPGSYLDVDLRMEIRLDDNNDPIGDPKYFVSKVYAVIPPNQQLTLFEGRSAGRK